MPCCTPKGAHKREPSCRSIVNIIQRHQRHQCPTSHSMGVLGSMSRRSRSLPDLLSMRKNSTGVSVLDVPAVPLSCSVSGVGNSQRPVPYISCHAVPSLSRDLSWKRSWWKNSFVLDAPTLLVIEELPAPGGLTTGSRNRQQSTLSTLTCCAGESANFAVCTLDFWQQELDTGANTRVGPLTFCVGASEHSGCSRRLR